MQQYDARNEEPIVKINIFGSVSKLSKKQESPWIGNKEYQIKQIKCELHYSRSNQQWNRWTHRTNRHVQGQGF